MKNLKNIHKHVNTSIKFVSKTTILVTALLLFLSFTLESQSKIGRKTKTTKVILVVNEKSKKVTQIVSYESTEALMEKGGKKLIAEKYPNSSLYLGHLKGNYKTSNLNIVIGKSSAITIETDKPYFPGDNFIPGDQFFPGDNFELGKTKAKVVSNTKGKLTLKI